MNEKWDLTPIYRSFDDPAFSADLAELREKQETLSGLTKILNTKDPAEGLRMGLTLEERIDDLVNKLYLYPGLRQAADTGDTEAGSWTGRILAVYSEHAPAWAAFRGWAAGLPNLEELIQGDEFLESYRFLLEKMARDSRHLLSADGEAAAARFAVSGSSAWSELQQYLTSTVKADFRGQEMNLPTVRSLAYDPDPQVRRDAYLAELACYPAIADPVAYALNSIKLETISECCLRGYSSPLAWTLEQSDMRRETLDAMMGAIEEYLPRFHRYLRAKAHALGHTGGLPWYDLFAPMGASSTAFTTQQAGDYLVELFSGFDGELAAMVARAFDEAWIDFYPRPGKAGGAFCAGARCLGQSRILTNFSGKLGDVVALAHELGHAFHNQCTQPHRSLNRNYSMPLAETASTFNECVVMSAAIRRAADDAERINLIESQLRDTTQIICDILSRYLFETAVFANREERFMDAATLCEMMTDAQRRAYGSGLDENCLHPYMWVCKSHYYGSAFYNFPYAFGGLFARGLYARYLQEGQSFVPKYKRLLYTTTVATAEDTAAVADIDLTDGAFWRSALQTVADQIDQLCTLLGE